MDPELGTWIQEIAEKGVLFLVLIAFIVASYKGKIRWDREATLLEQQNARLVEAIKDNARTTSEAVTALNRAMESLEKWKS